MREFIERHEQDRVVELILPQIKREPRTDAR